MIIDNKEANEYLQKVQSLNDSLRGAECAAIMAQVQLQGVSAAIDVCLGVFNSTAFIDVNKINAVNRVLLGTKALLEKATI